MSYYHSCLPLISPVSASLPPKSLVYEVLLTGGPGTGYAIARAAGLARANAYSALEGLVSKGAARVDGGRPRRYRPEAPAGLIARISNDHGQALERLSRELDAALGARDRDRWSRSHLGPGRASAHHPRRGPGDGSRSACWRRRTPIPSWRRRCAARSRPVCRSRSGRHRPGGARVSPPVGRRGARTTGWPGMPDHLGGGRPERDPRRRGTGTRCGATGAPLPPFVAAARLALERFGDRMSDASRRAPSASSSGSTWTSCRRGSPSCGRTSSRSARGAGGAAGRSGPVSTGSPARADRTAFPRSARSRGRPSDSSWRHPPPARGRDQTGRGGEAPRGGAHRSREAQFAAGAEAVPETGLRAVLVLPPGPDRDRLTEELSAAGYAVDLRQSEGRPAHRRPESSVPTWW